MVKRTLLFQQPAYLSVKDGQLRVRYPEGEERSVPIEDIGLLVLEHEQLTITSGLMAQLNAHNVAVVHCNRYHMPAGLTQPLEGNTLLSERSRYQLNASLPLKKQLWQQTVAAKIRNQAALLAQEKVPCGNLKQWSREVASGDGSNLEARAAEYYWKHIFDSARFRRHRTGAPPNNLLNYGYAILRAIVARALVGAGLLPVVGIHHRNKYNAWCLADDLMEPCRPFVDRIVLDVVGKEGFAEELTPSVKQRLLELPVMDVLTEGKKGPLSHSVVRTANSLVDCYKGDKKKLIYPAFPMP